MKWGIILLLLISCSVKENKDEVYFKRGDNLRYESEVRQYDIDGNGYKQTIIVWYIRELDYTDIIAYFKGSKNESLAYFMAFDLNKDNKFDAVIIDSDENGSLDSVLCVGDCDSLVLQGKHLDLRRTKLKILQ